MMKEEERESIVKEVFLGALDVHKLLGPGLLESTYEICLMKELHLRGLKVQNQIKLPVHYKGYELDQDYRIDMLVEDEIILELKSVEVILPIHYAQLMTYIKLSNKKLGILINFNSVLLKDGFKRRIL